MLVIQQDSQDPVKRVNVIRKVTLPCRPWLFWPRPFYSMVCEVRSHLITYATVDDTQEANGVRHALMWLLRIGKDTKAGAWCG